MRLVSGNCCGTFGCCTAGGYHGAPGRRQARKWRLLSELQTAMARECGAGRSQGLFVTWWYQDWQAWQEVLAGRSGDTWPAQPTSGRCCTALPRRTAKMDRAPPIRSPERLSNAAAVLGEPRHVVRAWLALAGAPNREGGGGIAGTQSNSGESIITMRFGDPCPREIGLPQRCSGAPPDPHSLQGDSTRGSLQTRSARG